MFEISSGDVFAGGGLDTLDAGVVVDFQNIAFALRSDQNIDAADGEANAMKRPFG